MFQLKSIAVATAGLLICVVINNACAQLRQPLSIDPSQVAGGQVQWTLFDGVASPDYKFRIRPAPLFACVTMNTGNHRIAVRNAGVVAAGKLETNTSEISAVLAYLPHVESSIIKVCADEYNLLQ